MVKFILNQVLPNKMHGARFAMVNSFSVIYHDFMHVSLNMAY